MQYPKILDINLSDFSVNTRQISKEENRYGGRSLISAYMKEFVNPLCNPLGDENDLIFAAGILTGSGASSSNRLSVGGKSPLTGGIKESNTGGKAGYALGRLGIRAFVLHGRATDWQILYISSGKIELLPATDLLGLNTYEVSSKLISNYGKQAAIICIGVAGEMQLSAASIAITDTNGVPCRHAARGGLAAVMGSKKIKAVVLDLESEDNFEPYNSEKLRQANMRFIKVLKEFPSTSHSLPIYGTAGLLFGINLVGGLATRNYSSGQFEGASKIDGEALYQYIIDHKGHPTHACMPGCVIRCSNIIIGEEGIEINRALEFETITLVGSNCGIDDLTMINRINKRCDEVGVDTMEIGAAIGVAMEGGLASFGDGNASLKFIDEIEKGTELGRIIGNGALSIGTYLGVKRIPVVKKQALAAYDPRVLKGTGVTYATSPMGADHTAGNALIGAKLPDGSVPAHEKADRQVELSSYLQRHAMIFDSIGLCNFTRGATLQDFTMVTDIWEGMYGEKVTLEDLNEDAKLALQRELEFNRQTGIYFEDDLPRFFREEPLPPTGNVFDVPLEDLRKVHT